MSIIPDEHFDYAPYDILVPADGDDIHFCVSARLWDVDEDCPVYTIDKLGEAESIEFYAEEAHERFERTGVTSDDG